MYPSHQCLYQSDSTICQTIKILILESLYLDLENHFQNETRDDDGNIVILLVSEKLADGPVFIMMSVQQKIMFEKRNFTLEKFNLRFNLR